MKATMCRAWWESMRFVRHKTARQTFVILSDDAQCIFRAVMCLS
jgi:uncharacterized membrane protein YsdA (DUF1294 family)